MDKVTVLMSTYNGEKYLAEQIESLLQQENVEIQILVRDDGSSDNTVKMLQEYKEKGLLEYYTGENLRSARSFMDLIEKAPESEFYAFCDQDDVWKSDKLSRAVKQLKAVEQDDKPVLYCSGYQLVDSELNPLPDNGHISMTSFNAALVASCCTGCTVVFNRALINVIRKGMPETVLMHDDWVHKVCLAVGGTVIYDPEKTLFYRQHGGNVDGGVHGIKSKISNIFKRISNKDCIRSEQIKELIRIYKNDMSPEILQQAQSIANYRRTGIIKRFRLAFLSPIKTPYERLNRGFRAAILLKYF
jgi:rhamnosyltransferase